jgi:predicted metal-dependent hydrolase
MKPDFVQHLIAGAEHFNARRFWEAHESWEVIWLVAQSDAEQFLQGLIQIAAAYHHLQRGTFRGGVRLFDSGLRRLSPFAAMYCGVDRAAVENAARTHRIWAAELVARGDYTQRLGDDGYPTLLLRSPSAPSDTW